MSGIAEYQRNVTNDWADYTIYKMAQALAQSGVEVSRKDIINLNSALITDMKSSEGGYMIGIQFADAGRYIDMTRINYRGSGHNSQQSFLDVLKEWVERVGPDNFKYVPGYKNNPEGAALLTDDKRIERIALGIFKHKMDNSTHQRKAWWSEEFYGSLSSLFAKLSYGYGVETAKTFQQIAEK
ncbi:hypothetical protein [Flammeovirga aprica]|uniref:Uncharacterized protein n=1 Tax=Flammeovirga aprica JL-4 TaxID=694437 RepID=A0A7X9RSG9_9BACT|nr:hypothetical protein [Flammeovirga aprica]NME67215.1 hypothetical protein [Flammeovirga aprica JL-4]